MHITRAVCAVDHASGRCRRAVHLSALDEAAHLFVFRAIRSAIGGALGALWLARSASALFVVGANLLGPT